MKKIFLHERKGIIRIVLGAILIILQVMSFVGNPFSNFPIPQSDTFWFDVAICVGYFSPTICGAILLFLGIRAFRAKE